MILKIYVKWDDKLPFECDCIAVGSERRIDERDITKDIAYLDFYYIERDVDGRLHLVDRDFKVENIAKIRGERNKGLIGFLDDAVVEALCDMCEALENADGVDIDVQIENDVLGRTYYKSEQAPKVEGIKEKFECKYAYRDIAKALKFDEEGFAYVEIWRWSKTEHRPVKANVRIFIRYRDEELDDRLIHYSIGDKSFEDKQRCSFCYTDQSKSPKSIIINDILYEALKYEPAAGEEWDPCKACAWDYDCDSKDRLYKAYCSAFGDKYILKRVGKIVGMTIGTMTKEKCHE